MGAHDMKPYSPELLADRWGCSSEKIRRMFHDGDLNGFRLGKLIRIPAAEVERYECQNSNLDGIVESASSSIETQPDREFDVRLARMMRGSPRPAPLKSGQSSPPLHRNG